MLYAPFPVQLYIRIQILFIEREPHFFSTLTLPQRVHSISFISRSVPDIEIKGVYLSTSQSPCRICEALYEAYGDIQDI